MTDIQQADVGRKLQLRYSLTGSAPAPFLSPELVPVVMVDDLTQFDVLSLTYQRPYEAEIVETGGVATRAEIDWVNPEGSGVLATLKDVNGSASLLGAYTWALLDFVGAAGITIRGGTRDARIGRVNVFQQSVCGLFTGLQPTTGVQGRGFVTLETVNRPRDYLDFPFILVPGTRLRFVFSQFNETMQLQLRWSERTLLPGELER